MQPQKTGRFLVQFRRFVWQSTMKYVSDSSMYLRVSALLFAINHTGEQVEGLLVEVVGQSLQDIAQSGNGSSSGTLGGSVELILLILIIIVASTIF